MNKDINEIKKFLLNKYHSCLDTALQFDLTIKEHYKMCGNCRCNSKHPCSCGIDIKLENLKDMLEVDKK